ncbi:MAG: hypothetical protein NC818_00040 [Candidatus Omnitrophica bacterium]|nr:hypothetical protein [Candidatus Omnitrophota bacterium]
MRYKAITLLGIILIFVLALVHLPSLLTYLVKREIQRNFKGSEVNLEKCILKPKEFRLVNFEIKQGDIFSFKTEELNIEFTPLSLLQREIKKCVAKKGFFFLNFESFGKGFSGGALPFKIKALEFKDINLSLKAKDFDLKAYLFYAELNPNEELVNFLNLGVNYFSFHGLELKDALLKINRGAQGSLEIKFISYGNLKVEDVRGVIQYHHKDKLALKPLSARFLKGYIDGEINLELGRELKYNSNLLFYQLDMKGIEEAFKLDNKLQLSGLLGGRFVIEGRGYNLEVIKGEFSSLGHGGTLIIKDKNLVRNLAEKSGQSFDIIWESFKDYHFDEGDIKIFSENRDLILKIILEGKRGKRGLEIRLHEFEWRR